jgi:cytochrome bd-type quinol oxidase subunit 2
MATTTDGPTAKALAGRPYEPGTANSRYRRWYVPVAIVITCGAILAAIIANRAHGNAPFIGAYILYGTVAVVWVIVPSVVAYLGVKEVGFPTFVWTLHHVYHRWPFRAVILLAALTVLLIHLALYPWPSIVHDLQHYAPSKLSP